jgi:hypothetical protein
VLLKGKKVRKVLDVTYRELMMPCCGSSGPRSIHWIEYCLPNFCPLCGSPLEDFWDRQEEQNQLRSEGEIPISNVLVRDNEALLIVTEKEVKYDTPEDGDDFSRRILLGIL